MKKFVFLVKSFIYCILGFSLFLIGCNQKNNIRTIDGPESTHLINKIQGYIITDEPNTGIRVVSLPSLKERIIQESNVDHGAIYSLSGPDKNGGIVYIENYMVKDRHLLKYTSLRGEGDEIIFSHFGDALWDNIVGENLSLSHSGKYVAFIGRLTSIQMNTPEVYLQQGSLKIWDVINKKELDIKLMAVDSRISWLPNRQKIAYVKLFKRNENSEDSLNSDRFGKSFFKWPQIPCVFIYDLATASEEFLHIGWDPIVSDDGKYVIVSDLEENYRLINIGTKESKPVSLPGCWGGAIAFMSRNLVLYWGLPTTGMPLQWTKYNSPFVGPKLMRTIKLTDLSTGDFQTVVKAIDPRTEISYGKVGD